MYSRVLISSLAKWLEKPLFCHSYTFFHVWPRDHYMPLQRFTMGHMPGLAKVVHSSIAMLRFLGVVCDTTAPLAPCEPRWVTTPNSHSSEQGTLPIASLISKQVVPYRTCGGTCCPGVSTPKTHSLADSSMKVTTFPTIPNLAQTIASNLTMVTSHQDQWKTNTLNTQHHKGGKTCTMTQDCGANQYYEP
jgi:hypothetical protein